MTYIAATSQSARGRAASSWVSPSTFSLRAARSDSEQPMGGGFTPNPSSVHVDGARNYGPRSVGLLDLI